MAFALRRLRDRLFTTPIGSEFLGNAFTLDALRRTYEMIRNRKLDGPAFRRRMLRTGLLKILTGMRRIRRRTRPRYSFQTG